MKTRVVLVFVLVFGGSLWAQPAPAAKSPAPAKSTGKADPKKADAKKQEPKIAGTVINRADGTFLGLTLEDGKFKLAFYDKEKKAMPVNVLRAVARWPNPHGPGQNRAVLNPAGDGTFLLAPQFVRGPYAFKLFLTLIASDDPATPGENYTLDFHG